MVFICMRSIEPACRSPFCSSLQALTEVGTAVAIGVLLDTLLVRTVLVPAALLTIGERVWWPTRPGRHAASVPADRDPVKV
jgi:uncharacterized membrane protein YdfJ with MMPL/SSD domain